MLRRPSRPFSAPALLALIAALMLLSACNDAGARPNAHSHGARNCADAVHDPPHNDTAPDFLSGIDFHTDASASHTTPTHPHADPHNGAAQTELGYSIGNEVNLSREWATALPIRQNRIRTRPA